jgi:hypothetical protein
MWAKRLAGNAPPDEPSLRVYARRLLFDADTSREPAAGTLTA